MLIKDLRSKIDNPFYKYIYFKIIQKIDDDLFIDNVSIYDEYKEHKKGNLNFPNKYNNLEVESLDIDEILEPNSNSSYNLFYILIITVKA